MCSEVTDARPDRLLWPSREPGGVRRLIHVDARSAGLEAPRPGELHLPPLRVCRQLTAALLPDRRAQLRLCRRARRRHVLARGPGRRRGRTQLRHRRRHNVRRLPLTLARSRRLPCGRVPGSDDSHRSGRHRCRQLLEPGVARRVTRGGPDALVPEPAQRRPGVEADPLHQPLARLDMADRAQPPGRLHGDRRRHDGLLPEAPAGDRETAQNRSARVGQAERGVQPAAEARPSATSSAPVPGGSAG
jgi:hypothetical protein